MSSVLNPTSNAPANVLKSISMGDASNIYPLDKEKDSESESGSDTTSDDYSSDEDKHVSDPVLKERLKQLDRYATPITHNEHSPDIKCKRPPLCSSFPDNNVREGDLRNGLPDHLYPIIPADLRISENHTVSSDFQTPKITTIESHCGNNSSSLAERNVTPYSSSQNFGRSVEPRVSKSPGSFDSYISPQHFQHTPSNHTAHNSNDDTTHGNIAHSDESYGMSYVCEICHAAYTNQSSLRSHMKKHGTNLIKRHRCEQCPYSTQYAKNLLKHVESMHGSDNTSSFRCERCLNYFLTELSLQEHSCMLNYCTAYRCDECGRVFKTKLRLKYHADVHNPRKPYVCDVEGCDRAFRTPKYLKNHRDEFHRMQPKNYNCPVEGCDLVFHRKTHLKRHVCTHTDTEKKYHCQWPDCQRRFCSEETLNVHYRKHTGEKPFSCALCPFSCYNKPGLSEHYHLHHAKDAIGEDGYKPFCPARSTTQLLNTPLPHLPVQRSSHDTSKADPMPLINGHDSHPVAPARHRMADILESCGTQPPGPLDAEINGILDSLDKESDLPDLFSSGTFDFEHSNQESTYHRNPTKSVLNPDSAQDQISTQSKSITSPSERFQSACLTDNRANKDCSLSDALSTVLMELEKADLSGSLEEFEKAKSHTLSLLPTFSTGSRLDYQIDDIITDVLQSFMTDTHQFTPAIFRSTRQFNRDEIHMLDVLEQQIQSDIPLTAPVPPRKRGRRPKLQHQLQPYLERIFDLDSVIAEAMAADLVSVAQYERSSNFCTNFPSTVGCGRGRGRGRGYRIRGRGGPFSPSLNSRFLPDGTLLHADLSNQLAYCGPSYRGSMINKRIRGGFRGRYRIDHSGIPNRSYPDVPVSEEDDDCIDSEDNPRYQSSDLRLDCAPSTHPSYYPSEFGLDQIGVPNHPSIGKTNSPSDSDEREQNFSCENGDELRDYGATDMRTSSLSHQQPKLFTNDCTTNMANSVNQDALGEMLEDLGVIVKRIGERAAAKRLSESEISPSHPQPLNLAEYSATDTSTTGSVASLLLGGCKVIRNGSDTLTPSVPLPSMATLASTSVDTPVSEGTDTPRSTSELQTSPPHINQPSAPTTVLYNSPDRPTTPVGSEMEIIHNNECDITSMYRSPHSEYHPQPTPMWSCESMCEHPAKNMRNSRSNVSEDLNYVSNQLQRPTALLSSIQEDCVDINQPYRPTDLSTRLGTAHPDTSLPLDSPKHIDPVHSTELERSCADPNNHHPSYPDPLSSNVATMGSLMTAVEAVDHLRSLSALGAKYTSSNPIEEEEDNQSTYPGDPPSIQYQYPFQQHPTSPRSCDLMEAGRRLSPIQSDMNQHGQHPQQTLHGTFNAPNMPPTLNSLLCRDRKVDGVLTTTLNSMVPGPSPSSKMDFLSPSHTSQFSNAAGNVTGCPYSPYQTSNMSSRCPSRNRTTDPNSVGLPYAPITPTSARSSASPSSSSSARSYLHDLYQQQQQREQCYRQQQQQQHPTQASHRGVRSPVNEITTRQLLSEAAATAYAHGLGRCEGQNFMGGLPSAHGTSNHSSDSSLSYPHRVSNNLQFNLSNSPYQQRFHQANNHYPDMSEEQAQMFHGTEYGNNSNAAATSYMSHNDPYNWYQHQLRQQASQQALARSMTERSPHAAQHLAHSINEVSGLAAAAYAYHQYHQQQQAHRHGLSGAASSNLQYHNLFNTNARNYYNGPVDDQQFTPRDLALYPNSHTDRRDPKSVYLSEDYRNGLPHGHGRFFF